MSEPRRLGTIIDEVMGNLFDGVETQPRQNSSGCDCEDCRPGTDEPWPASRSFGGAAGAMGFESPWPSESGGEDPGAAF